MKATYIIILHHKTFEKEVLKLPSHHQQKIYRLLNLLKNKPQVKPANTISLSGYKNVYRTRIGHFRLIYEVNHPKKTILVLGVGSRGNVYKLLSRMFR